MLKSVVMFKIYNHIWSLIWQVFCAQFYSKLDCIAEKIGQQNVKLSGVTFLVTFIQDFLLYVTAPVSDKII